ncbi:MAG TPA: ATP synthase F1 subunit delta [Bacteroidota bacterium]|nr:ATP synthase F1 subunit delta [Bacteroidota bacterium]
MVQTRIAHRYAEALLLAVEGSKDVERVLSDISVIQNALAQSRELRLFFKSPVIRKEKKVDIVTALFKDKVSELFLRFIALVIEKGRGDAFQLIMEKFLELYDERKGVVAVSVQTAIPMTTEQEKQLVERFRSFIKKDVRLHAALNPSLLGGFLARYGDTVIDGSVRHQLELMRARFIEFGKVN